MKYIIIHNVEDKQSREFVATYGSREDVEIELDDGGPIRIKYPYISAFPTVIIPVPDYKIYTDDLSYTLDNDTDKNSPSWLLSNVELKEGDVVGIYWDQTDLPMLTFI